MPIYEYEPTGHDCLMCPNRVEVMQAVGAPALEFCPHCGLEVRKVVSRMSVGRDRAPRADVAGARGLTTFRKVEKGKWEKVAGPGVDMIVGTPEDMAAVEAEKKPRKVVDLDGGK